MKPAAPPPSPPLALSAAQMVDPAPPSPAAKADDLTAMLAEFNVAEPEPEPAASFLPDEAELIDPEDIAFEPEPEPDPEPEPEPAPVLARPQPVAPAPVAVAPPAEPRPAPRPAMSVAQAAPLPDPTLSEDMAEELLAPTTDAAVKGSISRLSSIAQVGGMGGQTVEGMMRDMLRPMLKDWLDENLPALVERMVEKEIARISRGVK
jgi:cell pole-organizing protein PopZ